MANQTVETVSTAADKAKIAIAVALVIGAVVAYYALASQGAVLRVGALLALLVGAVVVFLMSEPGRSLIGFGQESVRETRKVVWPSRKEAIQTTAYVFAFVVVMALFLWLTDKLLEWVLYDLILGWRK